MILKVLMSSELLLSSLGEVQHLIHSEGLETDSEEVSEVDQEEGLAVDLAQWYDLQVMRFIIWLLYWWADCV